MKKGAYDYLPKPFTTAEVVLTLRKAEEREKLRREVKRLRQRVKADQRYPEIVAKSAGMREALELATLGGAAVLGRDVHALYPPVETGVPITPFPDHGSTAASHTIVVDQQPVHCERLIS